MSAALPVLNVLIRTIPSPFLPNFTSLIRKGLNLGRGQSFENTLPESPQASHARIQVAGVLSLLIRRCQGQLQLQLLTSTTTTTSVISIASSSLLSIETRRIRLTLPRVDSSCSSMNFARISFHPSLALAGSALKLIAITQFNYIERGFFKLHVMVR